MKKIKKTKKIKKITPFLAATLILGTNVYARPTLSEPNPGALDLSPGNSTVWNTNEWAEAHRQFLESTQNFSGFSENFVNTNQNIQGATSVTGILAQNSSTITDITNTNFENLVLYLYDMNYTNIINNQFRAGDRLTRADFSYMLGSFVRENHALLQRNGFPTSRRNNVSFNDINSDNNAYENLMELARRRIIHDTTSNIRPDTYITRLEAERWLRNLLDMLNFNRPIYFSFSNNITRLEMANAIMQVEMLINDGPVVSGNPLNLVRANARNFSPYGFELHLTVNNSAAFSATNINFRIGEEQSSVSINALTPIAIFTHNSVYSVFVPASFPGVHYVSVNLSLNNANSSARVVRAEGTLGAPNLVVQNQNFNMFGNNQNNANNFWNNNFWNTNLNEWAWNNQSNWQTGFNNWQNSWILELNRISRQDQWSQPNYRFVGWNTPESTRLTSYFDRHTFGNLDYRNNILFGNSLIEAEVRRQLGFSANAIITPADARRITSLSITIPNNHVVTARALAGLEHFTNLHTLRFNFSGTGTSSLNNLHYLRWLTSLRTLELRGHGINNLEAITTLTNLEFLDLDMTAAILNNNISHINYLNNNHRLVTWR